MIAVDLETRVHEAYTRHFTRHKRQPTRALGWPATRWLLNALTAWETETVLECGSGWSTTALRMWAEEKPGRYITTTDHKPAWLALAEAECVMEGLIPARFAPHQDLARESPDLAFDVVLVDLADTPTRVEHLAQFVRWTKPGGMMVLDDWHVPSYAHAVSWWMEARDWPVPEPIADSTDEWGRYLAVWRRP